ncbi:MAG: NapC/NirT family cytochrome c [Thermodesulfobacteriota bacterium]|nr:NapC/NirT family cytochrome c [Thermodesulfobacteriota bacterium]
MTLDRTQRKSGTGKVLFVGLALGLLLAVVTVLASGFMVETTNTDTFCVSCHAMTPFRTAWQNSVHGGQNPQGFTAQCVDCHLPHGNFIEYFVTKAKTGTSDVINNLTFDPYTFDWATNAEENRLHFTYDSACRHCHHNLTPPGLPSGGFIAHRSYLLGNTDKQCVSCHPHVGHKDMIETATQFFQKKS